MKDLDCMNLTDVSDAEDIYLAHLNEGRVPNCQSTTKDTKESIWYPCTEIMSKEYDGLSQCCDWKRR